MSLIEDLKVDFVRLDKVTTSGAFGTETTWNEGALFKAVATYLNSVSARVAEVETKIGNWQITVTDDIKLDRGDVIKRLTDGKILKIDTPNSNVKTPEVATYKFTQAFAYEYSLVNEEIIKGGAVQGV